MGERILIKKNPTTDIESYSFGTLKKALKMGDQEIIDELKVSGLKGRGGAGFPTKSEMEFCS